MNQYPDSAYASSYPAYSQNYGYNYQAYTQSQFNTTHQPGPPGEEYPHNNWTSTRGYPNLTQPPPAVPESHASTAVDEKNEAVAQEAQQQKTQLIKQREEYVRKVLVLRRELDLLKNQKQELITQTSPVRDRDGIIRENEKLQDEIQTKIKAIHNVIEMLSSIIKDEKSAHDLEAELDSENSPLQPPKSVKIEKEKVERTDGKVNYIHYDPELHWCRDCDKFPQTAKEFLLHLQMEKHKVKVQENDVGDNTPWHKLPPEPELPTYEGAPKKRIPIKGLQFFISAPSWYCKLCDTWIGDLHCASHHLKSQAHFQNYVNFVEQNPHWEMEWLKDREKALSRSGKLNSDSGEDVISGSKKKKKRDKQPPVEKPSKEKKKKKHSKKRRRQSSESSSSSSSSDSSSEDEDDKDDRSKSIRVAMRNVKVQSIMNEDLTGKWEMLGRIVEEHKKKEEAAQKAKQQNDDNLISQWMTVSEPPEKEKVLLDNLKDRMKQKHDAEKARAAEQERKRRDREREERELLERKQRELREQKEREERERKQRDIAEFERIRDQNRDHVRFKASRDRFRKRLASGSSEEESGSRHIRNSEERDRHYSSSRRRSPPADRYKRNDSGKRERSSRSSPPRKTRSRSRTRSKSVERNKYAKRENDKPEESKKKPPGPPSYKKLPFIGRMPLFKNKKPEDKQEKELKKEEYETPRQTRFQPGTLARAFIPEPEVVCFPKLATIPPLVMPPAPPTVSVKPPAAPKITEEKKAPKVPPAPKICANNKAQPVKNEPDEFLLYDEQEIVSQYYPPNPNFSMMYPQLYDFSQNPGNSSQVQQEVPHAHTMPLPPPPLPPAGDVDDLALLGISADDMAAQTF